MRVGSVRLGDEDRCMSSPFARAVDALRRPLAFAAADQWRGLDRVRELEATVRHAARAARSLAVPPDVRQALQRIERDFCGPLEREARMAAGERALAVVEIWADPAFVDAALSRPVASLPGVGPKRADALSRRGIRSVAHLLFHLPSRFDDRRALARIADLEVGRRATFVGRVLTTDSGGSRTRGGRYRPTFKALLGDDGGTVLLRWFHGVDSMREMVRKGTTFLVTGDVKRYRFDKEVVHPELERLEGAGEDGEEATLDLDRLRSVVPEYPSPEGIPPRTLRGFVQRAVAAYADLVESHLPETLARTRDLPPVSDALRAIHQPGTDADVEALRRRDSPAFERLILEELYGLEVGLALRRAAHQREPALALPGDGPRTRQVAMRLPFKLTQAQRRAWGEIRRDLARPHPMNRLLQGDVGSGKTVVAFLAAVAAAEHGRQSALMAPTELLAEQHARTLARLVASSGAELRVELLVASRPRAEREAVRAALEAHEVDLLVGTHALVQDDLRIPRLSLSVVDEQHRFGVLQRKALASKAEDGLVPHTLVMTATPIPRTLALTLYGDLDVSVIDELPPGRAPVATDVLREGEGRRVVDQIRAAAGRGEQIYVVYPLVEETEKTDLRAATESAERIRRAFPDLKVDLVHGRLDAASRGEAMARFERGETDLLVSTTVIEVGVDVPRATLMVVEHAERFGLAQLHQLRGRVGRGDRPGTCLLVARGVSDESEARLAAMLATTDGFAIADADLRIRGPGEFLGTRQHGKLPDLWVADLLRDARWIATAREAALETVRNDPGLARHSALRRAVAQRFGERLSLIRVG
jgi:ATP-dependent DNA helicase RecG